MKESEKQNPTGSLVVHEQFQNTHLVSMRDDLLSSGFRISHPLISLKIVLEEVDRLHIHEEIIEEALNELIDKISKDGLLMHPIIIDKNSLVVLDGMHRVAAIKRLGYRYIPVCMVDYYNSNIQIRCWYRLISGTKDFGEIEDVIEELELILNKCSFEEAQNLVEERKAITAVFSHSRCSAVIGTTNEIKEIYNVIKQIGQKLESKGFIIDYDLEKNAKERVHMGEVSAGLITPTILKEEVLKTATAGKVFSPKSTRHIIPARPMYVNVPLEWLHGDLELSEVNDHLNEMLSAKQIERLPPSQFLDRKYDEELYVFK